MEEKENKIDILIKKIDENNKELLKLKKEILYNRIIFSICLVISLLYIHYNIENFNDVLGTLIQIFMSLS